METNKEFSKLLKEEYIFTDICASTKEEALKVIAYKFLQTQAVKESYYPALLKREKEYPTGLEMPCISIAIPHADTEHANMPAIAIAKLNRTVEFNSMEDANETIMVQAIICLAITKVDENVKLLPRLLKFFMEKERAEQFLNCTTPKEILALAESFNG